MKVKRNLPFGARRAPKLSCGSGERLSIIRKQKGPSESKAPKAEGVQRKKASWNKK